MRQPTITHENFEQEPTNTQTIAYKDGKNCFGTFSSR